MSADPRKRGSRETAPTQGSREKGSDKQQRRIGSKEKDRHKKSTNAHGGNRVHSKTPRSRDTSKESVSVGSVVKKPKPRVKPTRKKLLAGNCVKAVHFNYEVIRMLGSGGFGDVYLVRRMDADGGPAIEFAMKTEYFDKTGKKSRDRLKIECCIFDEIRALKNPEATKHFVEMEEKGRTVEFKYLIMSLVGYSIESIRKEVLKKQFRWLTVTQIAVQTLEALRDFHEIGYLHRDLKPHNFAVGLKPHNQIVYLLDFGIARRYVQKDGRLVIPRSHVKFLGTVKYAPRSLHRGKEQARIDDIESWAFMILDLFLPDNLRWRVLTEREKILQAKDELFIKIDSLNLRCPEGMADIIRGINAVRFEKEETFFPAAPPDYNGFMQILKAIAEKESYDLDTPFEWTALLEKGAGTGHGKERQPTSSASSKKKNQAQKVQDDENEDSGERRKQEASRGSRLTGASEDESDRDKKGGNWGAASAVVPELPDSPKEPRGRETSRVNKDAEPNEARKKKRKKEKRTAEANFRFLRFAITEPPADDPNAAKKKETLTRVVL